MTKRKRRSSRPAKGQNSAISGKPALPPGSVPSAATLFRMKNLDFTSRMLVRQGMRRMRPMLWLRDRTNVQKIEQAGTAMELIDLLPLATGLAEDAWMDRVGQFGPEILPLIADRLKQMRKEGSSEEQDLGYDRLIEALRWRGHAGGEVLLDCFYDLDDYPGCLACVALGLAGIPEEKKQIAVNKISSYYEKAARRQRENFFVGGLWGLIDLKTSLAADFLFADLVEGRDYYELFGFLSLAGDNRAVLPLLVLANKWKDTVKVDDAMMALVLIARRIGRQGFVEQLIQAAPEDEEPEELGNLADRLLAVPTSNAQEHFAMFYRGFDPEDFSNINDILDI